MKDPELAKDVTNKLKNPTSKIHLTEDEAIDLAKKWLGEGSKELRERTGVYRSLDGTKQFRMDNNSLDGKHAPYETHIHLETIGPDGKPIFNNHIIYNKLKDEQ